MLGPRHGAFWNSEDAGVNMLATSLWSCFWDLTEFGKAQSLQLTWAWFFQHRYFTPKLWSPSQPVMRTETLLCPGLNPARYLAEEVSFLTLLTDSQFHMWKCIPYLQYENKGSAKHCLLESQGTAVESMWQTQEAHGRRIGEILAQGRWGTSEQHCPRLTAHLKRILRCVWLLWVQEQKKEKMKFCLPTKEREDEVSCLCIAHLHMTWFLWSQYSYQLLSRDHCPAPKPSVLERVWFLS